MIEKYDEKLSRRNLRLIKEQFIADSKIGYPTGDLTAITNLIHKLNNEHLCELKKYLGWHFDRCFSGGKTNLKKERYVYIYDKEVSDVYTRRLKYIITQKINRREKINARFHVQIR